MSLVAVKYKEEIKDKVDAFNALDEDDKYGEYWDGTDEELKKVKKYIKDHYLKVQDYTCVYCQQKIVVKHGMAWDIEHIIPKGPYPKFLFEEENLCISCKDCNGIKTNKNVLVNSKRTTFPKKNTDYIIIHPHYDEYSKSIKVIFNNQIYLPRDEKGKNTIEICGLLRFAFQYTNYGNIPIEKEKKILELTNQLMSESDGYIKFAILGLIRELAKEGQALLKKSII